MTGGRAACRGWCGSCTPRVEGRPEAGGGAGGGGAPAGCAANGQRSSHRVRPQKSWLRRAGGGSGARRTGHTGLQHSRQACRLDGQSNSTRCMPRDARRSTSCAGGRGLLRAAGLASCRSRLRWKLGLGADYRTHSLRARMFERTEPCARPRWSRPLPPPPASTRRRRRVYCTCAILPHWRQHALGIAAHRHVVYTLRHARLQDCPSIAAACACVPASAAAAAAAAATLPS